MSATTSIEWTDRTWNPTTGCDKVSPGCAHCYAETIAKRLWATSYPPMVTPDGQTRPRYFEDVQVHEDRLLEPLSWRKPSKVFVNSMSDLFHEDVPDAFIDKVFAVMGLAHLHTFQILTKRPERMLAYMQRATASTREPGYQDWPKVLDAQMPWLAEKLGLNRFQDLCEVPDVSNAWPHPNVWLGVSVENQHFADERLPYLLSTPAVVRFVSCEPLLEDVDLHMGRDTLDRWSAAPQLDWVIVGGESGPGARPFDLMWARDIVAQCKAASVPVFVKQLGADPVDTEQDELLGAVVLKDRKGGDPAEWPDDLRVREFPSDQVY